jgi:hypothetical protein
MNADGSNPAFNSVEFDGIRIQAGLNRFGFARSAKAGE